MKKIEKGQVWTISSGINNSESKSMLVLTLKKAGSEIWRVVPVHENLGLRTHLDVIIDVRSEKIDEHFDSVVIVHMVASVPDRAFTDDNSYFGRTDEQSLEIVEESLAQYSKAISKLSEIQTKDAFSPDFEDEDGDLSAITSGIFELCPVQTCELDELIQFNDEYCEPLFYWQNELLQAVGKSVEEPERANNSLFQTVAKKIMILVEYVFVDDGVSEQSFLPAAAGEAEKADHAIPVTIMIDGEKQTLEVILEWNDKERVTNIWFDGDCASLLCSKGTEITVIFENGEKVEHQFDSNKNFVLKVPLKQSPISKILLSFKTKK